MKAPGENYESRCREANILIWKSSYWKLRNNFRRRFGLKLAVLCVSQSYVFYSASTKHNFWDISSERLYYTKWRRDKWKKSRGNWPREGEWTMMSTKTSLFGLANRLKSMVILRHLFRSVNKRSSRQFLFFCSQNLLILAAGNARRRHSRTVAAVPSSKADDERGELFIRVF